MTTENKLMTLREAAQRLHVSPTTIYRLVYSGELKACRLRNSWRTSIEACDKYIESQFEIQALQCQDNPRQY